MMRTYYNNIEWGKNKIKLIIEDEKGRFATDILLNTTKEDIYHKKIIMMGTHSVVGTS